MKSRDRRRLGVMVRIERGDLTRRAAAKELGLSPKQVGRIFKRWREEGDKGLLHRGRGQVSNRAREEAEKKAILGRVEERYGDYGPTLAAETLGREGFRIARETLRRWLKQANPEVVEDWERRKHNRRKLRPRRSCFGELVQMDTSEHDWLENGGKLMLISMIDDATGRLWGRFYKAEGTENNMRLLGDYIGRFGRPRALYTDRAGHFAGNPPPPDAQSSYRGRRPPSQIARALEELGIEHILAQSPEAKGRIERSYRTLQDRLVKSLREHGIRTIEEANAYLENTFIAFWNGRFAGAPREAKDAHLPLDGQDLEAILCVHEERTVARDHTISIGGRKYQIALDQDLKGLAPGGKVVLELRLDGTKRLRHEGRYLKFAPADLALPGPIRTARKTGANPPLSS